MQKRKHIRGVIFTPLILLILFILTTKRYEISNIAFLVPNISFLFLSSKNKNKNINLHNLLKSLKKRSVFSILCGYDIFTNKYTLSKAGGILWVEL